MAKTEHTPIPWESCDVQSPEPAICIRQAANPEVCIADVIAFDVGSAEQAANAKFIVQACNSHEALLEACERAADVLPLACRCPDDSGSCDACGVLQDVVGVIASIDAG